MKGRLILTLGILVAVSFIFTVRANAKDIELLTLPDPMSTYDGTFIASPHDDFWSYSVKVMTELYDYWQTGHPPTPIYPQLGGFNFSTGTGRLDVLLYAGARGQNNEEVGGDPKGDFYFEKPVLNPAGGTNPHPKPPSDPDPDPLPPFEGWWGQDDQANDGTADDLPYAPVTVGYLLDYLHAFDPNNNIPVFYMDLNQTGVESSLAFVGRAYLYDAGADGVIGGEDEDADGGIQHEWAFDSSPQPFPNGFLVDGNFNEGAWVPAPGEVTWTGSPSGHVYSVNHNLGSGHPDFIAYAPSMNLGLYDPDWLFVTEFHLTGLNDGWEEIFLTGRIRPYIIPEPGTTLLLGMGVLGLVAIRRKKVA